MGFQPAAKRLIAGLTVIGLMFQAALVAAQLSVLLVGRADATAALPAGVICTEHGLAGVPSDDADRPSACGFCPLCLNSAGSQVAILPTTGATLVEARTEGIVFHINAVRRSGELTSQPRSRGPPSFA